MPGDNQTLSFNRVPRMFGRYKLVHHVRDDALGTCYLAVDEQVSAGPVRLVRCFHAGLLEPNLFEAAFEQRHGMLNDPRVVPVLDAGFEDQVPYMAYRLIQGVDMITLLTGLEHDDLRLSGRLAAYVAAQVADALALLHKGAKGRLGMAHGEPLLKNVILDSSGNLFLVGQLLSLEEHFDAQMQFERFTSLGVALSADENSKVPTSRELDVWCVAVGLWQMLAGTGTPLPVSTVSGTKPLGAISYLDGVSRRLESFVIETVDLCTSGGEVDMRQLHRSLLEMGGVRDETHTKEELLRVLGSYWSKEWSKMEHVIHHDDSDMSDSSKSLPMRHVPAVRPGALIDGRFQITSAIVSGTLSDVFEAEDTDTGQVFALKVYRESFGDQLFASTSFLAESEVVKRLRHPNLVKVYDSGVDSKGRYYVVYELLLGQSFEEFVKTTKNSERKGRYLRQVAGIVGSICEGLEAAHKAGTIHRDVRLSHVILNEERSEGENKVVPKLIDFGLPKVVGSDVVEATRSSRATGYTAPEIVAGGRADHRSDVYSLGVVLYEAITGSNPFGSRTDDQVVCRVLDGSFTPLTPEEVNPRVPSELSRICQKAFLHESEARYDSVTAFADDLGGWLSSTRAPETPATSAMASEFMQKQRPTVIAIGAMAVLAALVLFSFWERKGPAPETIVSSDPPAEVSDPPPQEPLPKEQRPQVEDIAIVPSAEADNETVETGVPHHEQVQARVQAQAAPPEDDKKKIARLIREGDLLRGNGALNEAQVRYEQVFGLTSRSTAASQGLAMVHFEQGHLEEAVKHAKRAARQRPRDLSWRVFLGRLYMLSGERAKAIGEWKKVLEKDPDNVGAQRQLNKAGHSTS